MINRNNLTPVLLRVGLATVFLYAAISSFISPNDWVGYLPKIARDVVPAGILLSLFSTYQLVLVAWLLSGKYIKYAALLVALTLAGIVVTNFSLFAITFRDVALIFAALALFFAREN